jgi:hypothetical protein
LNILPFICRCFLLQDVKELRHVGEASIGDEAEEDEDRLIAERRARRQAILEKHQKQKEEAGKVL